MSRPTQHGQIKEKEGMEEVPTNDEGQGRNPKDMVFRSSHVHAGPIHLDKSCLLIYIQMMI